MSGLMNILLLVDEPGHPGANYRGSWPIMALAEAGVAKMAHHQWPERSNEEKVILEMQTSAEQNEVSFPKEFIRDLIGADVIVIPQAASCHWYPYVKVWQGMGKVVVFDMDDDSFSVSPFSPSYAVRATEECAVRFVDETGLPRVAFKWEDRDRHEGKTEEELAKQDPPIRVMPLKRNRRLMTAYDKALREADGITTTTERAAKRFREINPNVFVCPNSIDTDLYIPGRHPLRAGFRIGWFGGNSHDFDLRMASRGLAGFLKRHADAIVVAMGNLPRCLEKAVPVDQLEDWPWVPLDAHPWRLMGLGLDLGFCAVEPDTPFNACKSSLKWTEFGAVGVPAICTDAAPYSDAVRHGEDGWLVPDTDAAWDEAFERLYTDQVLRKRLAQGARTRMEKDFDLYRNAHLWLDAYEALIAKRHPLEIVSG
jgi:hypothetical protein